MDMPERYGDWRYLREMQIGDGGPKGFFNCQRRFPFFPSPFGGRVLERGDIYGGYFFC